jgi:hypothetical protein
MLVGRFGTRILMIGMAPVMVLMHDGVSLTPGDQPAVDGQSHKKELGTAAQPRALEMIMPSTSPIAQPVRQCRVALAAVFQESIVTIIAHYSALLRS